jgi:hypothetical protein
MLLGNLLSQVPKGGVFGDSNQAEPMDDSWSRRTAGDMADRSQDTDEYSQGQIEDAVVLMHQQIFKSYKNWATKMAGIRKKDGKYTSNPPVACGSVGLRWQGASGCSDEPEP